MTSTIEASRAEAAGGAGGGNASEWASVAAMANGGREPTAAEVQAVINEAETITAEAAAVNEAETTINGNQEKVGAINREKKDAWRARQEAEVRKAANKERRGKERMARGEMPKGRAPGESYDEWMEGIGEAGWVKEERARETFQKESAALEEWISGGQMSEELYDAHPRKARESDADYAKRIKSEITIGICAVFRRETGESTEEWKARAVKEGEQPSKIKTAEGMKESEDAENFRELTNKNPREADESIEQYEARLSWLNEKQKETGSDEPEMAPVSGGGEEMNDGGEIDETVRGSDEEKSEGGGEGENNDTKEEREPLVTHLVEEDKGEEIRMKAENMLSEYMGKGNRLTKLVKRLVWGGIAHDLAIDYYYDKAEVAVKEGAKLSDSTKERLAKAEQGFDEVVMHSDVGERFDYFSVETNESGEEVVYKLGRDAEGNETRVEMPADSLDAKVAIAEREAIADFADGKTSKEDFQARMDIIRDQIQESGGDVSRFMVGDHLEVAVAAKERVDHGESIRAVMEGYRTVHANLENGVRTEIHQTAINKLNAKLRDRGWSPVARRILVGAAGAAIVAGPIAASIVTGGVAPVVGTMLIAGGRGVWREFSRTNDERAIQGRRLAEGEGVGKDKGLINRNFIKHNERLSESQYSTKSAGELSSAISEAIRAGDMDSLRATYAEAKARVKLSDTTGADYIKYGSKDGVEGERMALDLQIAEAEVALRGAPESESLEQAIEEQTVGLLAEKTKRDGQYKRYLALRMIGGGVKSAVISGTMATLGQEIRALFDENQYGLFEAWQGVAKPPGAKDTFAMGIGRHFGFGAEELSGADLGDLTPERAEELRKQGLQTVEKQVDDSRWVEQKETVQMSTSDYSQQYGTQVRRDGWFDNGTPGVFENAETAMHVNNGGATLDYVGEATSSGGGAIDVGSANLDAYLSLSKDTASMPIKLAKKYVNGVLTFYSDNPTIQQALDTGSYGYLEVATSSVGADGLEHIMPVSTSVGTSSLGSMAVETTTRVWQEAKKTVYNLVFGVDPVPGTAAMSIGGLATILFGGRRGLTRGEVPGEEGGGGETPSGEPTSEVPTEEAGGEAEGVPVAPVEGGIKTGEDGEITIVDTIGEGGTRRTLNGGAEAVGEGEERSGEPMGLTIEPEVAQDEKKITEYVGATYPGVIRTSGERERYKEQLSAALREWRRLTDEERQAVLAGGELPDRASGLLRRSFGDLRKLGYI